MVKGITLSRDQLTAKLAQDFDIEETHSTRLWTELDRIHHQGGRAYGVAMEGGHALILRPKNFETLTQLDGGQSRELNSLDVTVLHRVILERILGVQGLDNISYTRDPREAERMANQGGVVAFLMNPPSVEDMRTIALGGEKMPQKSTYYFPKILSGLVLWSLSDFD